MMSAKDFVDVINEVEGEGVDIFEVMGGFESVINMLIIFNRLKSEEEKNEGFLSLSETHKKVANKYFDILRERGYYDRKEV